MPEAAVGRAYGGLSESQRRADRRDRLIAAGTRCFGRDGYVGTSVEAVCAEAHVGKRYFYESFPGLEAFLIAVYEHLSQSILDELTVALAAHPDDLVAGAHAVVETLYRRLDREPEVARIVLSEVLGRGPHVDAAYRAVMDRWVAMIAEALRGRGYREAGAPAVAGAVFGLVTGTALRWQLAGRDQPVEDLVLVVGRMLADVVRGLD